MTLLLWSQQIYKYNSRCVIPCVHNSIPSWVRSWRGWQQARENLEEGLDDPLFFEEAIIICIQEFSVEVVSKIQITAISDEQRRAELQSDGKIIGQGLVYGSNACCADSLFQVLIGTVI